MIVINLFAGPGAGKSTTAAGLFHLMKLEGYSVELVTEYAKQLAWQRHHNVLNDQFYVTAKQNHRMEILRDQVEYCITDSPILLGIYYSDNYFPHHWPAFIRELFDSYENQNYYIKRKKKFVQLGRNQNIKKAIAADAGVKNILRNFDIDFMDVDGDKDAPRIIFDNIKRSGVIHL